MLGDNMKCEYCKVETKQMNLIRGKWTCIPCGTYNNKDLMKALKTSEPVSNINPTHYTDFAIPPNEYITANKLEWEVGNVIKYVTRYEKKNGLEDLVKAQKYIALLIERKYS